MQAETRIRFPEVSPSGLTFYTDRVEGESCEQLTVPRDQLRAMMRKVLWHALTCDDHLEGKVNGTIAASPRELELQVGDYEAAMLYCAQRDAVVVRPRRRFTVSRVEFAWAARSELDWVESLQPDLAVEPVDDASAGGTSTTR